MGVGDQHHVPAALPPGKTQYPLYRRLRGPQNRCLRVRKISLPQEFDPQTAQPVASRYTDWAIPAHNNNNNNNNINNGHEIMHLYFLSKFSDKAILRNKVSC